MKKRIQVKSSNCQEILTMDLFNGKRRINLCNHPVVEEIKTDNGPVYVLFHEYKNTPRVVYERTDHDGGDYSLKAVKVENLPKKIRGIEYIVSRETLRAIKKLYKREDFRAPGEQVRDPKTKKVVYCRGLLKDFD